MIFGKIGYFSLLFSLIFSFLILFIVIKNLKNKNSEIKQNVYYFSFLQLLLVVLSFLCLVLSFVKSNFSLVSVYENSHTDKPLFYKIAGTWGNHEGSLLLWLVVLVIFSFLFLIKTKNVPNTYKLHTIGFQNIIIIGFLSFSIFTSNPFVELLPTPEQGLGLNPILQDPALAIHPPTLYIGYVGSSIFFSSALAAMMNRFVSKEWARSIKPWIFVPWVFLTIGILLGAVWAYYELGWGGFWFWDPVENASLLPWLASTALLHSIVVLEKRNIFHSWTIILAIITFTLSMTGTFMVRSGILNSVHTFANDPSRGLFILVFLISLSLLSLIIFFLFRPSNVAFKYFNFFSKETSIIVNNWFMMFFLISILIGTVYPIFLEVINGSKISVGAPFYNFIIIPFVAPFLIFMTFGPKLGWIQSDFKKLIREIIYLTILTFLTLLVIIYVIGNIKITSVLILFTSLLLLYSLIIDVLIIFIKGNKSFQAGRLISHLGFGLLVLSIALNANLSVEKNLNIKVGEHFEVDKYKLFFENLIGKTEANYDTIVGNFHLLDGNKDIGYLKPEIRIYHQPPTVTSEASIKSGVFRDFYITMTNIKESDYFNIRFQYKPFMNFIWFSALLIALGGLLSIFKKDKIQL